jgi:phenylpropionate dioxygenase-like ring-hydroxylating dioxygenase large terminal subunit
VFLKESWYVAALTRELSEQPIARTILGEYVAMYRSGDGRVVALSNTCPHRGYPLSLGKVVGDTLVCGYHGFTFDCKGICVAVPGQDRVPSRLRVRTYPLVEQGAWVWIWMGHGEPDMAALPHTPWLNDEEWTVIAGVARIDANVGLLVDNLMDLSHETFLHSGSIGTPEVATTPIEVEVDEQRRVVNVYRHMNDVACPPFYATTTGLGDRIDRWQDIDYFPPGYYQLNSRIAEVGEYPKPDGTDDHAFHMKILYGLTPSTATSVWDFWVLARDFARDDRDADDFLEKMQVGVVQEDVDALNVLQRRIDEGQEITEMSIKIDRGGLAARRLLDQLLEEQLAREG